MCLIAKNCLKMILTDKIKAQSLLAGVNQLMDYKIYLEMHKELLMAQNLMIKNQNLPLKRKQKTRLRNNIVKIGHLLLKVIKQMVQNKMINKFRKKIIRPTKISCEIKI